MFRQEFNLLRALVACLCIFALLEPRLIWATSNDGYQGNTVSGRPSIAVVTAPGGTNVNTLTGNLYLSRTHLHIPGRGLPLDVQLAYNSDHNTLSTSFGYGWTFNYGMRCQQFATRNVVIQWGDGRMDLFRYKGGSYAAANEAVPETLQKVGTTFQVTNPQQIQFVFDATSCLLQKITDPNGNSLTFAYTGLLMTTITDAAGRSMLLSYDGSGRVILITDPNASPARTLKYAYSAQGNLTSFTDPLGNITIYSYDSGHRLTQVTDPLGVTTITYGAPNMTVASVARSDLKRSVLSKRSFVFDKVAQITTVTDMISANTTASTKYHYDAHYRLTQITDPLGHPETRTYDANGYICSVTDPLGNTTQYTNDANGNILTKTDALGHTTTFTYDPIFNKPTSVTDANGHTETYSYDSHGNMVTREDALGNLTQYSYGNIGQLVSRQDARGFVTAFAYDAFGNRISLTDPLGRVKRFTYDHVGDLVSRTDGNNHTTGYTYDQRNRLLKVTYPDLTQASFTYDSSDNMLSAVDPNTNSQFTYDANGSLVQVKDSRLSKTMSYQYDGLADRVRMTDGEGAITTYSYDLSRRLTSMIRGGEQFVWTYDNADRPTQLAFPNNAAALYSYDSANNLLSVVNQKSDASLISSFSYQYDNAGNRTRLTLAGGDQINYSYDGDNQLVQEVRSGATPYNNHFSYDAVGNRLQLNSSGVITAYAYDAANELTGEATGANNTAYLYDGNGNRVQKTVGGISSAYAYNFNDQQIAFASPTAGASYLFDALGRRVTKSVNGTTTQFFYDALDAIAEYDGAGAVKAHNLFRPGIDQNLARFTGTGNFYYLHDGLNSVRNLVDDTQTVQNTYDYDGWGNILAKTEGVANDYTFTGRQVDRESTLYHYRARAYDPSNGRFTQVDIADDNTGRSLYAYVDNTPASLIDPVGAFGWLVVAVVIVLAWAMVQAVKAAAAVLSPKKAVLIQLKRTIPIIKQNRKDMEDILSELSGTGGDSSTTSSTTPTGQGANSNDCTGTDGAYAQGSP